MNKVVDPKNIRIAYIGGGSRGWARGLMSDLALERDMCGTVVLYDIDEVAAEENAFIGNSIINDHKDMSPWKYEVAKNLKDALTGCDFVVISILPGTFDEMESDVHAPEEYGIYQSVGDTVGAGGIIRALRTVPMYEVIAKAIKDYSPEAWVINYTNPMAICVNVLYQVFPKIKAFGCCHEVFGTQELLCSMLKDFDITEDCKREDIKVNVIGINHFTWLNQASYKGLDLMPLYKEFAEKYKDSGFGSKRTGNWMNDNFRCEHKVKFDLFLKYGVIAAAGDRHLAEFVPQSWYMDSYEKVLDWGFNLTTVEWRKKDLEKRLSATKKLVDKEEIMKISPTGEEGVRQMKALIGLGDLVTNVNLPNMGQISNLPLGTVVETNAVFTSDSVKPVFAGSIPENLVELINRPAKNQTDIVTASLNRDLCEALKVFKNEAQLDSLTDKQKEDLFNKMVDNTKNYLAMYEI